MLKLWQQGAGGGNCVINILKDLELTLEKPSSWWNGIVWLMLERFKAVGMQSIVHRP